jgi:transposase
MSYASLLLKYSKKNIRAFKHVITDTSFIPNKKGRDVIGYNRHYNKKKGTKISIITDNKGIPFNVKCYSGNKHDSTILIDQLETNKNIVNIDHVKRNNDYFLADPAYDSNNIRLKLNNLGYKFLTAQNRRNTKNPDKIRKLTDTEKKIYVKRLVIERTFNTIKTNRRLDRRYDLTIKSYSGFLFLAFIKLLC